MTDELILQPRMLMLGSTGRNSGKTELACRIIRSFSHKRPIVGIKVTTIRKRDGSCPRGGSGCGVCSSLKGDFCITEERSDSPGKDTVRMLEAGARKVFWLRVMKDRLREGYRALEDVIGENAITVCESNSLRRIVEPGLFLVVRQRDDDGVKESCCEVIDYADRVVVSDGSDFSLGLDGISLVNDEWFHRWAAAATVLAGGESSRMGHDKSMLSFQGKPLIQHVVTQLDPLFADIRISTNTPERYAFLGLQTVGDIETGRGPLMGIMSALKVSENDLNFVTACDIPEMNIALIRSMIRKSKDYDAVVPVTGTGRVEPLFALYRKSMTEHIRRAIESGGQRIRDAYESARIRYIAMDDSSWLYNINSMQDYEKLVLRNGMKNDTL